MPCHLTHLIFVHDHVIEIILMSLVVSGTMKNEPLPLIFKPLQALEI